LSIELARRSPDDQSICEAPKHPISPIRFLRRGLLPPGFDFEGWQELRDLQAETLERAQG
jgi:hypothetical protein